MLCNNTKLAKISAAPGKTQLINHYTIESASSNNKKRVQWYLSDLPGYGYAKVPDKLRDHWRATIDAYLRSRESLKGIVLVMDARHPLREFDRMMLDFARATGRESLCLLTKADKLSRGEAARTLHAVNKEIAALAPGARAQLFSSLAGNGVEEARRVLAEWLFGGA